MNRRCYSPGQRSLRAGIIASLVPRWNVVFCASRQRMAGHDYIPSTKRQKRTRRLEVESIPPTLTFLINDAGCTV